LPPAVRDLPDGSEFQPALPHGTMTLKEAEKELMIRALKETGGNKTSAAEKLGMSRRHLHRKIIDYGLKDLG